MNSWFAMVLVTVAVVAWMAGARWRRRRVERRIAEFERLASPTVSREHEGDAMGAGAGSLEERLERVVRLLRDDARLQHEELAALARDRDLRELILAHLSDGVILLDRSVRVAHMNHAAADLLHAARPAAPGVPLGELVRSPEFVELARHCIDEQRTIETTLRRWFPNEGALRATATPLGSHSEAAVLLVLEDRTEVERVDRLRRDFVANVSHELRTPLTSVRGYAETLLEGGLDDEQNRRRFVGVIRDQAARLQGLVDDLMSLAELERSEDVARPEAVDLFGVASRQVAAFRPAADRAGLTLRLEAEGPLIVTGESMRLDQALANLIDNAIKYTDRGGVIVRLGRNGGSAWCEVEDTGEGIPGPDQSRVFERFYRVDKARSREKGGTGLGLAIVKHIVSRHGGDVSVTSEPGRGSRFRIDIPIQSGIVASAAGR
jgi:two-component system phosphate regulon sensor histidine kinase PhoR